MSKNVSTKRPLYWLNSIICLLIMFCFGFITPAYGLTKLGVALIGILLGTVYGWITIDIIWPSMAGFIAMVFWGVGSMSSVLKGGFGNSTVLMMLFMMIFALYMSRCGCMDAISRWFLSWKFTSGRPYMMIIMFFILSAALSIPASNLATMLFVWPMQMTFCEKVGYNRGDKYPVCMLFTAYLGSQFGQGLVPIKAHILSQFAMIEAATGGAYAVRPLTYSLFQLGLFAVVMTVWLLSIRFVIKPDVSKVKEAIHTNTFAIEKVKLAPETKSGFAAMITLIVFLFAPELLPESLKITIFFKNMAATGCALLILLILSILTRYENAGRFDFNELANSGKLFWNIIFMTAFALQVASVLAGDKSGFGTAVETNLIPILKNYNPVGIMIGFGTILHLLTAVLSNGAMTATFVTPMATIAMSLGLNPIPVCIIAIFAMTDGLLTPAGTASSPMLMGHEWMNMKEYYKHAITIFIAFELFIVIASIIMIGYR